MHCTIRYSIAAGADKPYLPWFRSMLASIRACREGMLPELTENVAADQPFTLVTSG